MNPIDDARSFLRAYMMNNRPDQETLRDDDIFIVHFSYIIGGWKCEMATGINPGYLFQVTHNKDFHESYLDVYVKKSNSVYMLDEVGVTEISTKDAPSRPDIDIPNCPVCNKPMVWSQGKFVCNGHEPYDENTLKKVHDIIEAGVDNAAEAVNIISNLQNAGILFRERV